MTIETDYYGTIEYEPEDLLIFEDGLFGFPKLRHFLPLSLDEEDNSILMLVSIEEKRVVFIAINPFFLMPDYQPVLTPEELSYLGVPEVWDLSCYAICVVKDPYQESTVNLKCPVFIHPETHKSIQVVMDSCPYQYRHPLKDFLIPDPADSQKGGHADAGTP